MLITHLLLVVQVLDGKPIYRKSWAGNLLVWSDLTLDSSFKVKRGAPNLKVLITCLLLVLEFCNVKPTYRNIIGWESFGVVGFDLCILLQGQMRIAKPNSKRQTLRHITQKHCTIFINQRHCRGQHHGKSRRRLEM